MKYDWLIVGAGYTGCVLAERIATQLNEKVLLIDKRDHIGGNAYDYWDEHGILVHKYGPHIFHTNSERIRDYLSRFTEWTPYSHHVLAVVDGKKVPVPFNLNSIHAIFSKKIAANLEALLIAKFGFGTKIPILKLMEDRDPNLKHLADFIYKNIFYGYTLKQWERKPEDLDPSVTGRVPVYISRDNRYFQDHFQAMPRSGYTEMFKQMTIHPNITVALKKDFPAITKEVNFSRMIYSGPMDAFFDYIHGELPYRSLKFDFQNVNKVRFQEVAQVNFPNDHSFTRITEFKHFTGQVSNTTSISLEYPQPYIKGQNEPYYPIPKEDFRNQYNLYNFEAQKLKKTVLFAGRLADYQYYNMDQAIGRALSLFEKEIA